MTTTDAPLRKGDDAAAGRRDRGWTWRRLVRSVGPGLVTGASDDDPSGIATYAQAGAQFRNGTLWTVLFCLPLMMAVQEICDRTALATGKNLGELARVKYQRAGRGIVLVLLVALLVANTLNVAADLMAIGQGMQLLHAGPATLWAMIAGIAIMALLATGSFEKIALVFKALCLSLLAYIGVLFATKVSWGDVARGLAALQLNSGQDYWAMIVAILGTTLSPYLFFWQSAHRVEELREEDLWRPAGAHPGRALKQGAPAQAAGGPVGRVHRDAVLRASHVRHHRGHRRDPGTKARDQH